jgi:MerR family transcriptional regulator, light-induced transcriptional regulator
MPSLLDETLSVKTICQLTGINEHTLRAWERRYHVVQPRRLDNGRRVYSIEDLEKLKLISVLIRKGFAISSIAQHSQRQLSDLINDAASAPDLLEQAKLSRADGFMMKLEDALSRYELVRINMLLQQAKAEYGVQAYLFQVVLPLLSRVGELVLAGSYSIGQEHALSAVVRYHLMQIFYLLAHSHAYLHEHEQHAKSFAIATMEHNLHEFGILISAVLCAFHGYPVFYLGPNMPAESLADAARSVGANGLILGLPPYSDQSAAMQRYLNDLLVGLPPVCEVWIGGSPERYLPDDSRVRRLESLAELDHLLSQHKPY